MGDVGEYWADHRAHKKAIRAQLDECFCGRKCFPGETCNRCGKTMPERELRKSQPRQGFTKQELWEAAVIVKDFKRCEDCGALFIDTDTLIQHSLKRHPRSGAWDDWDIF